MMRVLLTSLFALVLGAGVLAAGYWYKYPNHTYRYRLTVNIEVDGKVHAGSSVIEVTWHSGPMLGDIGPYSSTTKGQAALIDLGDRGLVVASLLGEDWGRPYSSTGGWGAVWLAPRAFGFGTSVNEMPEFLKETGKRDLVDDNLPRLLLFSNPQDPATARLLPVRDIPSVLGPSVRFAGASVEITNDPIVIDVRQKLAWLETLEKKPPGSDVIYLPNKLGINRNLFIGDAS
jgi:hypothetical protein